MIVSEHSELLSEGGKGGKAGISIDEDLGVQEGLGSITFSRALGLALCLMGDVVAQAVSLLGVLSVVLLCYRVGAEDPRRDPWL